VSATGELRLIADVAQLQSSSNALIRCWLLFRAAGLLAIAKGFARIVKL
jgi:hypothetical protein